MGTVFLLLQKADAAGLTHGVCYFVLLIYIIILWATESTARHRNLASSSMGLYMLCMGEGAAFSPG